MTGKSFRTFDQAKRAPARPMQPVIDPAGWSPEELEDVGGWSYHLTAADSAELIGATESIRRNGMPLEKIARENFRLRALAAILCDVRRELLEGRGIVMLQDFPIEQLDREAQAIAYLGLGAYLGRPMSQNMQGHILGHVKDIGGDYSHPTTRGYLTRAELRFHADGAESGLPGYEVDNWNGVIVPRGTPRTVVDRLNGELNRILKLKDVAERLQNDGAAPAGAAPEEFGARLAKEMALWSKVLAKAGVKVD